MVLIGAVSLIAGAILDVTVGARAVAVAVGVVLLAIGIVPAFFVRIPEGSNAILLQRGRFLKTLGPGNQRLMPWIAISHLVTSREIPFDIPAAAVANSEGVRVAVDLLVTIRIVEPEKFVFAISAPDFDQVCQASGQDAIRRLIRGTSTDEVLDLSDPATDALKADIGQQLGQYGVRIEKAVLTAVRLPDDVMRSLESRRLATTQRAEETEIQALRLQRESSSQALDQQRVAARRRVIEIEAENETFRLAQLAEAPGGLPGREPLGLRRPAPGSRPLPGHEPARHRADERRRRRDICPHGRGDRCARQRPPDPGARRTVAGRRPTTAPVTGV